ncbi:sel1 repeat family protein [Shewanella sp. 1CM18E]|uniref:tetratricopeptide repeat protein n=1 Tax=Shewanella sp. 1CM18E TaxID=2929169 RepID=UPI0020C0DD9A|nr:sel1 repeat family protein [Shewanella sp. 1CM18E]
MKESWKTSLKDKLNGLGVSLVVFGGIVLFNALFGEPPIKLSGIDKYSKSMPVEEAREIGFILFKSKHYSDARAFFTPAANQGDIGSQLSLATLYFYDLNAPDNYQKAYRWFSQNSDNAFAQYYLSLLYHFGYYVPQSPLKSLFWLEKSAKQSFPAAQHNLSVYYFNLGNYREAYLWALYARGNGFSQSRSMVSQVAQRLTAAEKANADQTYRNTKTQHEWNDDTNQTNELLEQVF